MSPLQQAACARVCRARAEFLRDTGDEHFSRNLLILDMAERCWRLAFGAPRASARRIERTSLRHGSEASQERK